MEKMLKEIMEKLNSMDEKIDTLSQEVRENGKEITENRKEIVENRKEVTENRKEIVENRKEIAENRKIMQHCFGDVYIQHDETYKKLNTLEEEVSGIANDVDSLISKTSRNSQKIRRLDKELQKTQ